MLSTLQILRLNLLYFFCPSCVQDFDNVEWTCGFTEFTFYVLSSVRTSECQICVRLLRTYIYIYIYIYVSPSQLKSSAENKSWYVSVDSSPWLPCAILMAEPVLTGMKVIEKAMVEDKVCPPPPKPQSLGVRRRANTSHRKSLTCYWLREMRFSERCSGIFTSSGIWQRLVLCISTKVYAIQEKEDFTENVGTTFLRNIYSYMPVYTAFCLRRRLGLWNIKQRSIFNAFLGATCSNLEAL